MHQRSNYSSVQSLQTEMITGQVVVMGPDDLMVSVARWLCNCLQSDINEHNRRICVACAAGHADILFSYLLSLWSCSSLNRPFGSRIITRTGVILNSLILDFSLPNKTRGQPLSNQVHYHLKSHWSILLNMVNYLPFVAKQSPARKEACVFSHAHSRGASMA